MWTRRGVIAATAAIAVVAFAGVHAQPAAKPKAAAKPSLTAQDYIDIRALAATYAYGLDSGEGNGALYASIFAPDAEFHGPPARRGGAPFDAKGRDELGK